MDDVSPYLDIDKCPDCGSTTFGVSVRMSGKTESFYEFNGEVADNSHLHDCLNYKECKTAYCEQCKKRLGIVKYKPIVI